LANYENSLFYIYSNDLDFHNFTLKVFKMPIEVIKNRKPQLLNFKMTPAEGNINSDFKFSVKYHDLDYDVPVIIQIVIDGISYDMYLQSGEIAYDGYYEFTTKLTEGEHTYYFTTSDGRSFVSSDNFTYMKHILKA